MAGKRTPEEQAAYMREYRARRRNAEDTGLVTLPGKPEADNAMTYETGVEGKPTPILLTPREYENLTGKTDLRPRTVRKPTKTVQNEPETAKNDLETTLRRQRAGTVWINPFGDGLDDTGWLIQRMGQHARDRILEHPAIKTGR